MEHYHDLSFRSVRLTGGFWKARQELNRCVTADAVYDRFAETHRFEALACDPDPSPECSPHIYWDSDIAKWIEGAAYIIASEPNPHLEALCDAAIADIITNQEETGYFNSYYLVKDKEKRFSDRNCHELYCAGHLFEAACAYYEATGKNAFLNAMCRYADYLYDVFYVKGGASFVVCGHPEIELALVKLARTTGKQAYLDFAKFFVDMRGNNPKDRPLGDGILRTLDQSDRPLKEQTEAEGHAVRAHYIYSGMADIAREFDDEAYFAACERIFDSIVERRMYITGGTGSLHIGEAFTVDYHLPNQTAYAETCASIALGLFARRMLQLKVDAKYADAVERVMYNGALSGVSLDGKAFFYENPLEIDPARHDVNQATTAQIHLPIMQRVAVFNCSCCPPNILRFIASIAENFYTYTDDTVFVHQYAESTAQVDGCTVVQQTAYPCDGKVTLTFTGARESIALRIPGWCEQFTVSEPYTLRDGYAYLTLPEDGKVTLCLDMPVRLVEADPHVQENAGRVAVMRGPVVYCAESVDNGELLRSLSLVEGNPFTLLPESEFGVPALQTTGLRKPCGNALYRTYQSNFEPAEIKLIPYFAFANRGISEMLVWMDVKSKF